MEHIPRQHALRECTGQVDPDGMRHLDRDPFIDQRFEQVAANPHRQGSECAQLADVPVEMHHECAGNRIADFGSHLMADTLAFEQRHVVLRAPFAGADMKFLFLGGGGGHHVIDEHGEIQIGVSGKIIGRHVVGLGHHLIARLDVIEI